MLPETYWVEHASLWFSAVALIVGLRIIWQDGHYWLKWFFPSEKSSSPNDNGLFEEMSAGGFPHSFSVIKEVNKTGICQSPKTMVFHSLKKYFMKYFFSLFVLDKITCLFAKLLQRHWNYYWFWYVQCYYPPWIFLLYDINLNMRSIIWCQRFVQHFSLHISQNRQRGTTEREIYPD